MALQRLHREFIQLQREPLPVVGSVTRDDNDQLLWKAEIIGPEDSLYENALIYLDLKFSNDYPMKPPELKFNPPVFHANVHSDGRICINLLSDWRPTDNVSTILLAVSNLLANPNRDNCVLKLFLMRETEYYDRVRKWAQDNLKNK